MVGAHLVGCLFVYWGRVGEGWKCAWGKLHGVGGTQLGWTKMRAKFGLKPWASSQLLFSSASFYFNVRWRQGRRNSHCRPCLRCKTHHQSSDGSTAAIDRPGHCHITRIIWNHLQGSCHELCCYLWTCIFLNVPLHIEVTFCSLTYYQEGLLIDHLRMAKGWTFPLHKAALEGLDARLRKEVMASEGAKELFEKASACQGATKARVTKTKRW